MYARLNSEVRGWYLKDFQLQIGMQVWAQRACADPAQKPEDIPQGSCLDTCNSAHGDEERSQMLFGKPGMIHT